MPDSEPNIKFEFRSEYDVHPPYQEHWGYLAKTHSIELILKIYLYL